MGIINVELSTAEICSLFDVSKVTLQTWHHRGMPKSSRGRWPLKRCFDWYVKEILGGSDVAKKLSKVKLQYWTAKTQKEEIDAERRAGEIINVSEAMKLWAGVMISFKTRLEAIPKKLAPVLYGIDSITDMQEILHREVVLIQNELSEPDLKAIARSQGIALDGIGDYGKAGQSRTRPVIKRVGGSKSNRTFPVTVPGRENRP
jgi:phage terminase Nu1 subunit (DNA packaging protein)